MMESKFDKIKSLVQQGQNIGTALACVNMSFTYYCKVYTPQQRHEIREAKKAATKTHLTKRTILAKKKKGPEATGTIHSRTELYEKLNLIEADKEKLITQISEGDENAARKYSILLHKEEVINNRLAAPHGTTPLAKLQPTHNAF